ncbi:MAG: hypothetical protein Q8L47_00915 [bacterium]|nr:hypothetical protein [bacterium]
MSENEQFLLALVAPIGITTMGLLLGIPTMFFAGLVFTGFIIFARYLRSWS